MLIELFKLKLLNRSSTWRWKLLGAGNLCWVGDVILCHHLLIMEQANQRRSNLRSLQSIPLRHQKPHGFKQNQNQPGLIRSVLQKLCLVSFGI